MAETSEKKITERAKEIQTADGGTLGAAMVRAEAELLPKPEMQTKFKVMLECKPHVADWVLKVFQGTDAFTLEQRLGAYLSRELTRIKTNHKYDDVAKPGIGGGTMRNDDFREAQG